MTNRKNIELQFSYLALKLLGKDLYSNAWAALSELVANGLDANATRVNVYIDMRDKQHSVIEVFDNGKGMRYEELKNNYALIGRNRRMDEEDADSVMGRKGIGKLAALYLSRKYYIASKTKNTDRIIYMMDFSKEKEDNNNEVPELVEVDSKEFSNSDFNAFNSGTMIRMENVNLKGYAKVSINTLKNVLADFFSVDNLNNQEIYLKVITSDDEKDIDFSLVEKLIPFKNMTDIFCFDNKTFDSLNERYSKNTYKIPYKKGADEEYTDFTKVRLKEIGKKEFETPSDKIKVEGNLTGWIGIHSSISADVAKKNDANFKKNKLYNPLKLRIYVRNKLAIDNFLPVIDNTQVFSNFIEGEVGFDILDDNNFPDIATTSRQNMDESDERIIYLAQELQTVITELISSRQEIAKKIKIESEESSRKKDQKAKEQLSDDIKKEIDKTISKGNVQENNREDLENLGVQILKNIKGEIIKKNRMIFFSHARNDKDILDFYFNILKNRGVDAEEMFYTSQDIKDQVELKKNLDKISKKNIIDTNTVMFFYLTKSFRESEYCMFEGGAAWATRTKSDIFVSFDEYENVPKYLNNENEFQHCLTKETDLLSGDEYNRLVQSLNFLIEHINEGRRILGRKEVEKFEEIEFPDKVQQSKGKMPELDSMIFEYWDAYVNKGILEKAKAKNYIH